MYAFLSSCRNPLKRSVGLVPTRIFGNACKYSRPVMPNGRWYCKNKDENGEGKEPKDPKKVSEKLDGSTKDSNLEQVKNSASGPLNIRIVPVPYTIQSYDERNQKLGRQLSPHLSIYRKQLTSVMSILLRMSGFMLGFGIWTIGLSGLIFDININDLADKIESCNYSSTFFRALKFGIILPFAYHVVAGTRHLVWYLNVLLSKKEIYATGYLAAVLALLLAASLASIDIYASSDKMVDAEIRQILLDEDKVLRDNAEDCFEEHENERECICQDDEEYDER